jgi:hypothetical protein
MNSELPIIRSWALIPQRPRRRTARRRGFGFSCVSPSASPTSKARRQGHRQSQAWSGVAFRVAILLGHFSQRCSHRRVPDPKSGTLQGCLESVRYVARGSSARLLSGGQRSRLRGVSGAAMPVSGRDRGIGLSASPRVGQSRRNLEVCRAVGRISLVSGAGTVLLVAHPGPAASVVKEPVVR